MFYVHVTFLSVQPRRTATQSTLNGSKCHHHSQDNQLTVLTLCVKTKLAQQANGLLPRPHTHKEVYREARKKRGCGWKHKSCSKQSNSKHQSHSNQSPSKPAFLHYWLREAPMPRLPTTHERAQKNEILIKTCKLSDLKAAQLPELPSPPSLPHFHPSAASLWHPSCYSSYSSSGCLPQGRTDKRLQLLCNHRLTCPLTTVIEALHCLQTGLRGRQTAVSHLHYG